MNLQGLNSARKESYNLELLQKYARLHKLIATNSETIPALHRIFRNADTYHWSVDMFIEKIYW